MYNIFRKIWQILSLRQRKKLIFLVSLMVLAAGLEILAITSLLPVIAVIQKPDLIYSDSLLSSINTIVGGGSPHSFLSLLLLSLLFSVFLLHQGGRILVSYLLFRAVHSFV